MRTSLLFVLLLPVVASAQVKFSSSDMPGLTLQFTAGFEPPARTPTGMIGSVMTGKDRQHRIITDHAQKRYFGYDFRVEPRGGIAWQVRIEPLQLTSAELKEVEVDWSWTKISLPNYPVAEAKVGDRIALDVLVNPSTGQKVVDVIALLKNADPSFMRDIVLTDIELEVAAPKLRINGKPVGASAAFGGALTGSNLWFYVPGHGRYIMSLLPNEQGAFVRPQKAGQVEGRTLTFTSMGVEYRVESDRRIAPGSGRYNIYVSHNATWLPREKDRSEPFLWGSYD